MISSVRQLAAALITVPLILGTSIAGLASAQPSTARATDLQAAPGRPNIVMIMVDDMRNDDLKYMPWTRRLIRQQGVRFTNSFSPFPLCCPARASVLNGRYTHNHGVYSVHPPYGFHAFDDRSTLATWLQAAGYWTVYVGKYLNGYGEEPPRGVASGNSLHYVPPGWTKWRASIDGGLPPSDPRSGSTYYYYNTTLSRDGIAFDNYRGRYQSAVYGEIAQQVIERRAASPQPFFFYLSFTAPHNGAPIERDDPTTVPQDHSGPRFGSPARPEWVKGTLDRVITAAPGRSWWDPDYSDKPEFLRDDPPLSRAEWAAALEVTRQRAEALTVVDFQVKRTMDTLSREGLLSNTYVLFTSDNGYFLGEQRRRQGKIFPYEPSLRVPLLMRGPGIPRGQSRSDPFTSIDFAPTLAAAAGVAVPRPVDGVSLLGVARGGDQGWSRAILTETGPLQGPLRNTDMAGGTLQPGEVSDPRFLIGIRTRQYLYTDVATGEEELYDLEKDPQEYRNLVHDPAYAQVLTLLRQELQRMRTCSDATCRAPLPAALSR